MNRSAIPFAESCGSSSFKMLNLKYLAILILAMVALPFLAFGQDATIIGSVTDPAGAVVPNVVITVTHVATNKIRTVTTSDSGQYAVTALEVGLYNIKAELQGFKIEERQNVKLDVAQRERVDFQLRMGTTAESISVEGDAVAVQTDNGAQSSLLTGQQLTQLATNGRSIYNIVNLTTGASSLQPDFQVPTPVGGNANVSFNGNRTGHNIYLLDGGENLDRGGSGTFSVMPSLDSLAETQIQSSNYSAQYGLSSGATITTVVRSGTKDFHATLWEFLRNNALDARNFFNPAPAPVAKLNLNIYGFNVGGPVTFGKLYNPNRTKTFFFFNMEWRSLIQGGLTNQQVPPTSEYGGDFGATPITVPTTAQMAPAVLFANCPGGVAPTGITQGSAFPNNTIPSCMISPNATSLLNAGGKYGGIFPAPTGLNSNGLPVFIGGNNTPTNVREEIVRIDENLTDKFTIFGHFIWEKIDQGFGTTMWSGDNVPSASNSFGNPSYSGVVHTAYVINPNLVNEIAFNYNGNRINIAPTGLSSAPSDFTFNRFFNTPNDLNRIPSIQLKTTGSNFTLNWVPWQNAANDYQIRDDVSWTKGRHQIKFGGSWALYTKVQDLFAPTQGSFVFDGSFTGNDFADYLLGAAQNYQENALQDSGHWNNQSWALYIEDNYRVNNRLTLNLGLRWDGVPHTYEVNNRASNFYPNFYNTVTPGQVFIDPTNPSGISPTAPYLGSSPNPLLAGQSFYLNGIGISGQPGVPRGLVNNHWLGFGPRLGFAYDIAGDGKTVIRGGFGIMYERIQGNDMYNAGPNVPFSASVNFNDVSLNNPHQQAAGTTVQSGAIPVSSITGLNNSQYQLPSSTQFSLGVQRAIGKSVFSASYVGSQNRHQNFYQETNLANQSILPSFLCTGCSSATYNAALPYLGYHAVEMSTNEANGDYNSLQLAMRGTVKSDLTYQLGYTYAHSNDPSTNGTGSGGDLNPVSNPYEGWKYDWGPSAFDRRNVFFANFVYDIPLLRNSENKWLKTFVGGWEVSGVVTAETGAPVNLTIGSFAGSPCNVVPNCSERPDISGSLVYPHTVSQWFSTSNISAPAIGTWGNLGHNAIRGPGRDNWDLSLFKNFLLSESRGSSLQFRAEFFNIWNHTQFKGDVGNGGLNNSISFNSDGSVAANGVGAITAAYDPRTIQFGLKLIF
jgi:Carboxypeptidase regulatory-like domain